MTMNGTTGAFVRLDHARPPWSSLTCNGAHILLHLNSKAAFEAFRMIPLGYFKLNNIYILLTWPARHSSLAWTLRLEPYI